MKSGVARAEELMLILSAPARSMAYMSATDANAAADGEWHETLVGGAFDHVDHRGAAMRGGGDVEEHHFIRALLVVAQGQFHRVAHVAEFARFGFAELDAAGDVAAMDIEAGNDAAGEHSVVKRNSSFAPQRAGNPRSHCGHNSRSEEPAAASDPLFSSKLF